MTESEEQELAPLRRKTAGRAHGAVLELGAGTGANLQYYPRDVSLTAFEPNPAMAKRLRRKAAEAGRTIRVDEVESERLPYADATFDTVVTSLVLCSVPEPAATLAEVKRVLRPGGAFLFLEHVAARDPRLRTWQRRLTPLQRFVADGCELDRDTASVIRSAGFAKTEIEEFDPPGLSALTRHLIAGSAIAA